jgi:methyl-accepting chemotaxis protein
VFNKIFLVLLLVALPYIAATVLHFERQITTSFEVARGFGSQSDFVSAQANLKNSLMKAGILLVPLLILAVFAVTNSLGFRTKQIAQMAQELARGNLEQDFTDHAKDEIGQVNRAMQQMTAYQRQMAQTAIAISDGDLSQKIQPHSQHDVLGNAFAEMIKRVRYQVSGLLQSAASLQSAAAELEQNTAAQSQNATTQNKSVAQTSSTLEEVQSSSEQIAQTAKHVVQSAQAATQVALVGVGATRQAERSIAENQERVKDIAQNILELSEQTQAIGDIIQTLSKLADQTNLLALNAAIEAARAGEHGKGFAVVAGEIRILAERSKTATSQIAGILSEIQSATNTAVMTTEQGLKSAETGTFNIGSVASTIENLEQVILDAKHSASSIQQSLEQHLLGIGHIHQAMQQVQYISQQTLESSQATQSASQHLSQLAQALHTLASRYKL